MIGVYIHIPFCKQKCLYCDFPSYGGILRYKEAYVDALCREIGASPYGGAVVDTVYFGGGTPSLLSTAEAVRIMTAVRKTFTVVPEAEVTFEGNPESLNGAYAADLAAAGVNRLSFGVQTFDDRLLRSLGRAHTAAMAREAVTAAVAGGIKNISVDLMYGLPGQTTDDVAASVRRLLQLPVVHASVYSLIVEDGTPLQRLVAGGKVTLPGAAAVEAMGAIVRRQLAAGGFEHYEISSYAVKGRRSRHNSKYWQCLPYIGFGVSAHSFVGNRRWSNIANIPTYCERAGRETVAAEETVITRQRAMEDYCFLALRMKDGIDYVKFAAQFGCAITEPFGRVLASLEKQGLITGTERGCRLSSAGLAYGNYVFGKFLQSE